MEKCQPFACHRFHPLINLLKMMPVSNSGTEMFKVGVSRPEVVSILEQELDTAILNEMHPWLWLVAKKSSQHVDSLHEHVFKNRTITIAENPALHLVWMYDRVYLKPIPCELLNYRFWINFLIPQVGQLSYTTQSGQLTQSSQQNSQADYEIDSLSSTCQIALGFLRTYSLLIQHESDFVIAQSSNLIPKSITYPEFEDFISAFRFIGDEVVSKRYMYGQFRLTRLNWAVRLCRPASATNKTIFPWYYHEMRWQTADYLRDYGAVAVFIFAVLSLILSSLQVMIAVQALPTRSSFLRFSWVFSIITMIFCASLVFATILGIIVLLLVQTQFAARMKYKKGF
ncbi:hypothetical protein BGZ63DRAFT_208051 [Mariannaea sp. PMI_226]|nr:hypothetical protein BGZ63DRAFT_208051 [Mariannaea sp. PMI_226]